MDSESVEKYQEKFDIVQSRYKELISDYKNKTRASGSLSPDDTLELALVKAETLLLDCPPLSEVIDPDGNPTGIMAPKGKGLITGPPKFFLPKSKNFRDDFVIVPSSNWSNYLGGVDAVDGRNFVPDGMVLDQDGVGSCASESMTGMIMKSRVQSGQEPVKLNPWFAYHTVSGGHDGGSTLHDNVAFAQDYGVPTQDVWPRSKGWRTEPSEEAKEDARKYRLTELWHISDWEEFGSALLYFGGVYFGYSGHAIWATKLLDTSRVEYCNSWSDDWGDEGFGTLSKSQIQWGYGSYCWRVVTHSGD